MRAYELIIQSFSHIELRYIMKFFDRYIHKLRALIPIILNNYNISNIFYKYL